MFGNTTQFVCFRMLLLSLIVTAFLLTAPVKTAQASQLTDVERQEKILLLTNLLQQLVKLQEEYKNLQAKASSGGDEVEVIASEVSNIVNEISDSPRVYMADVDFYDSVAGGGAGKGTISIEIDFTAPKEMNVYLPYSVFNSENGITSLRSNPGFEYTLYKDGEIITEESLDVVKRTLFNPFSYGRSTLRPQDGYYFVPAGEKYRFDVAVTIETEQRGEYHLVLDRVYFADSPKTQVQGGNWLSYPTEYKSEILELD